MMICLVVRPWCAVLFWYFTQYFSRMRWFSVGVAAFRAIRGTEKEMSTLVLSMRYRRPQIIDWKGSVMFAFSGVLDAVG